MNLTAIEYFVVTAKELHFAHAAEKLGIAQPPLSRSIQKLEAELGVQLFSRDNKWKVSLTAAGEAFLPEAERLLRQTQYACNLARSVSQGMAGRLTVGAISSMIGHSAFIDALADMQKQYPHAVVEIVDSTSGQLEEQIREHSIDLALMRLRKDFADEELLYRKLYDDQLSLVLSCRHRLAKYPVLTVAMLADEPFILVPEKVSGVFRNYIRDFCRSRGGFDPEISREISNSYTALRLTAAGVGITMVSSAYDGIFGDRLCYRTLSDFQPSLPMYAVYPAETTNPLASTFLDLLLRRLKKNGSLPYTA